MALVWAFKPLKELHGATGFVDVDDELAEKLLAADKVQDPSIGARDLRAIEAAEPEPEPKPKADDEYETRDMQAKPRGRRK